MLILPWFSRHTYHAIGKYNKKGHYMIHRVYIRSNLNFPFGMQDCDQLEGSHSINIIPLSSSYVFMKQVYSIEGEHCWSPPTSASTDFVCNEHILMDIQPSIPALSFVGTNLLQDDVDKHCVSSDQGAYMFVEIFMRDDSFHSLKHGHIPLRNNFDSLCFHNPALLCFVQDRFQTQSTPRTAFLQGEDEEDMSSMGTTTLGEWH